MKAARLCCCLIPLLCVACATTNIGRSRTEVPQPVSTNTGFNSHPDESCFVPQEKRYLRREIRFEYAKAALTESSVHTLDQLIAEMEALPDTVYLQVGIVAGHTDTTGDSRLNSKLRDARGKIVGNYLIGRGFPSERIFLGKSKDLRSPGVEGDNRTVAGRRANRRADIEILMLEGVCPVTGQYPHRKG